MPETHASDVPAAPATVSSTPRPQGPWWTLVRFFGSLRLAMVLFIVIIVACAFGTLMESKFDARVARFYVYDAPWFTIWLLLLCINLAAAALTRWPWKRRHTGFIVVHAGIILLIAGSWIGQRFGIEGSLTLRVGEAPRGWMLVQEMALTFTDPVDDATYRVPLPLDLKPPRQWEGDAWDRMRAWLLGIRPDGAIERSTPDGSLTFVFDRFSEALFEEPYVVASPGSGSSGVNLEIFSGMMGQTLHPALLSSGGEASTVEMMGMAEVRYVRVFGDAAPAPAPSHRARALLEVRLEEDGRLRWRSRSSAGQVRTGTLQRGEVAALGWADWALRFADGHAEAGRTTRVMERPNAGGGPGSATPLPGARGWLQHRDGTRTETQWFLAGETYTLSAGGLPVRMAIGYRTEPLPFTVELSNFEVPRDEGTQNPADFKSTLTFRTMDGLTTHSDWCSMNQPALFPHGLHRHLTGFTYKFSQASWNPEDLKESTVQVLRDPGWIPKWVGSLVITVGIYLIFYMRPYRFRRPEDAIDERRGPN